MFVVGLLLILLGALAIVAAVFGSEGTAEFLSVDLSAFGIFVIGLVDGLAGYIVAIAVGTVVTGLAVVALKSIGRRPAAEEAPVLDVTDATAVTS